MKHDENTAPPPPRHRRRVVGDNNWKRYSGYLIILFCGYWLGYFSSSSSSSSYSLPSPSPLLLPLPLPSHSLPQSFKAPTPTRVSLRVGEVQLGDHNLFLTQCGRAVGSDDVRQTILDRVFNGSCPWQDFPPAHIAPLLRRRRIAGWGSNGAVFENLIREVRPKVIIEIGTFLGASALHMVGLTRKLGLHDTQIVCIDDFRGWPGFQEKFKDMKTMNGDVLLMHQFMQNVAQQKATDSVVMMPFSTGSALDKLCEWGVTGELIEVDAGHDFHSAWSDINMAYKILRPGGVIFGHDYFTSADNRGVRRAVHLFARLNNLTIHPDGQHWVIRSPVPSPS